MPRDHEAKPRDRKVDNWYQIARNAHDKGDLKPAIHAYQMALNENGENANTYHNLGLVLLHEGCLVAAVSCYRRALHLEPDSADTWSNLGNAYRLASKFDQAETCLRTALKLERHDPDFAFNLGLVLREKGCLVEAIRCFKRASEAKPQWSEAAFEHAITLLQNEQFVDGFTDYERRLDMGRYCPRDFTAPVWNGTPLNGRKLLVHAEQGYGDMIQFVRFIPQLLAYANGEIILECYAGLKRLFAASFSAIKVYEVGEPLPDFDLCVPLMSLAHVLAFDDTLQQVQKPYLHVPADISAPLVPMPGNDRLKVGMTWAGKATPVDRSCPFEEFLAITEVPGVEFFSLQRGHRIADIKTHGGEALIWEVGSNLQDFADDAAFLQQLDLVITIDTAMCHLAGAIGKPTWTLLTFVTDWRFHQPRNDSPWYPTMRLFRQPKPDDWRSVINAVKQALRDLSSP